MSINSPKFQEVNASGHYEAINLSRLPVVFNLGKDDQSVEFGKFSFVDTKTRDTLLNRIKMSVLNFFRVIAGYSAYKFADVRLDIKGGGHEYRSVLVLKEDLSTLKYAVSTRNIMNQQQKMKELFVSLDPYSLVRHASECEEPQAVSPSTVTSAASSPKSVASSATFESRSSSPVTLKQPESLSEFCTRTLKELKSIDLERAKKLYEQGSRGKLARDYFFASSLSNIQAANSPEDKFNYDNLLAQNFAIFDSKK